MAAPTFEAQPPEPTPAVFLSGMSVSDFAKIVVDARHLRMGEVPNNYLPICSSVSDVRIDRIAKTPTTCEHPTPNTPQGNFEVFNRTWAENYILSASSGVE
jgi:hypothetical protein